MERSNAKANPSYLNRPIELRAQLVRLSCMNTLRGPYPSYPRLSALLVRTSNFLYSCFLQCQRRARPDVPSDHVCGCDGIGRRLYSIGVCVIMGGGGGECVDKNGSIRDRGVVTSYHSCERYLYSCLVSRVGERKCVW